MGGTCQHLSSQTFPNLSQPCSAAWGAEQCWEWSLVECLQGWVA